VSRRLGEALGVSALAIGLTVVMTWPLPARLAHGGRTDKGDGLFSIWVVAWVSHALTTEPDRLFDANIFFPEKNTLAYSEANLGAGALGVPVWLATRNPYATHNFVVLLAFGLSFVAMYVLARTLVGPGPPAIVAGILFAFCPYVFGHTAHIQLLLTAGMPAAMAAMHRLVERPGPVPAIALGLILFAQAISCGYYGVLAGMLVTSGVLVFSVTRGLWRRTDWWGWVALAAGIAIALSLPVLEHYRALSGKTGFHRGISEAAYYAANVHAWTASSAVLHHWMLHEPQDWPEPVFPGFVALILGLVGLIVSLKTPIETRRTPRDVPAFYLGALVTAVWLTFGPRAGLYEVLYRVVPLFEYLRAPSRFAIGAVLALAVGAAFGTAWLSMRWPKAFWMGTALCALAVMDVFQPPYPVAPALARSAVYRVLASLPPGPVVELPYYDERPTLDEHTRFMVDSTLDWHPRVNGYSDYVSPMWRADARALRHFPNLDGFAVLHRCHARYLIVHRELYGARDMSETDQRLALYRVYLPSIVRDGTVELYEIAGFPKS
jgi:hypothetical protein